ncbi:MAG: putative Ig domain-containing protein, partial [Synergistaceae bacterium]|nr:putative Ig domain-containing protein [Synergistaceae bacterium]
VKVTQTAVKGDIPTTTTRKATFTGTPKASGGANPYVWSVSAGKLPDGLKLNTSTGKITGSTSKAGTFNFTVKAKDKNGAAGTKAYTVKVTQTAVKGDIPTTTTRKATFTGTPKASGGASPYVWSVSAGKLPDGLKLNTSTGKITGSASKAGTFNFTVKAKDKNGAAGTKAYTVKVTQTKVTGTLPNAVKGSSYTATPKASNGASPYVWSVSSGKLPIGLKLNSSTGKITGIPSKTGNYTFTIKAKDKNGAAGTKNFTVKVTASATAKSSLPEAKSDATDSEAHSPQAHNTVSSLPVLQEQTHEADGNNATPLKASLRVISDDIIESHEDRDSDIFTVKAGQPLTFILGDKISGAIVCIDDEPVEVITISDEGTFTLPAEFVYGDFKVQVKSSDGNTESEEAFIISE